MADLPAKIDPADLAAHNAKVARAYKLQIDAERAIMTAAKAVSDSVKAMSEKYGITLGVDVVDDETGVITRAKAAE